MTVLTSIRSILFTLLCIGVLYATSAQNALANDPLRSRNRSLVKTQFLIDHSALQPPRSDDQPVARIGIRFIIEPGWHIYWKNSGEAAIPTEVKWKLPEGWRTSELRWPTPSRFVEKGDVVTFGYRDEVMLIADLYAPLVVGPDFNEGVVVLAADVSWLVCEDSCVPGNSSISANVPFGTNQALGPSDHYANFERFDSTTPRPLSFLRRMAGYEHAEILPILENKSVQGGQTIRAGLRLERFALFKNDRPENELQIFPDPNEFLTVGHASVKKTDGALNVLFELSVPSGVPSGPITQSGILVISCAACGTERDISIPWSIDLDIVESSQSSSNTNGLHWHQELKDAGAALTFRSHSLVSKAAPKTASGLENKVGGGNLFLALLAAYLAGIILNIMPCVLPVLSLKIFGFVESAQSRAHAIGSALVFSLGILTTFTVLAAVIISLKSVGAQIGWGFQFQHFGFVFFLTVIVFLFSLGFFELYTFNPPGLQVANRYANKHQGRLFLKHFSDGILATLLSTPCTAPFLGTALAFAFTQSAVITVAVFLSIGLGLATPYVLLASNERILKSLPKPGPWMDTFKKVLGFFLLGTVVWLLYVMQSLHTFSVMPTLVLLFVTYFVFWLKRELQHTHGVRHRRKTIAVLAFTLIALLALQTFRWLDDSSDGKKRSQGGQITWRNYSPDDVQSELRRGKVVFIDFTADWCITCKFNEKFVVDTEDVRAAIEEYGVATFQADWTTRDEGITTALKRYGGHGVPYYVVLSPHREGHEVLPTVLTGSMLKDGFDRARQTEVR